jgi:hypothetical protein
VHFRWRTKRLLRPNCRSSLWAVVVLTSSLGAVAAQDNESAKDAPATTERLELGLRNILRFFDDWRRTRTPLSRINREAIYHRELVVDDIFYRINQYHNSSNSGQSSVNSTSQFEAANELKFSEIVSANINSSEAKLEHPHILRSADAPVIGHVDCAVDYQCMCRPEHVYNAAQIDGVPVSFPRRRGGLPELSKLLENVRSIPKGKFYDCYSVTNHHEGFQKEMRCRFVDVLAPEFDLLAIQNIVKNTNIPILQRGRISELAIENAVRVKEYDRKPIERASEFVRPIYAIINGETYFFEEIFSDPGIRCALTKLFDNPIFDISVCKNKESCTIAAIGAFLTNIDVEMRQNPIAAELDMHEPSLPGERNYVRNYKPSEVLGGAFYESSQYILQWYRNEIGRVGPPGGYTYSKGAADHPGDFLFARIRQSLSVRPGPNGPYPEASRQQYAPYEEAIAATIAKAVGNACGSIEKASLEGKTCKLLRDP